MNIHDPILKVSNLTKRFGDFTAVDNISFDIDNGDIFGFLGHNGAGKTTTVNMLTSLTEPTEGKIIINSSDIRENPYKVKKVIGYVPENVQLYAALTAYENLEFFAGLSGIKNPKPEIINTLVFLNALPYKDKKTGALSKGMRQRIGLAQAIIHRPAILFLDEPTSGLDPMGIRELRDIIMRLNRDEGMTIFMNTHLLSEVSKTCRTIGVLSHGRLIYKDTLEKTLKRFRNESELESIYTELEKV